MQEYTQFPTQPAGPPYPPRPPRKKRSPLTLVIVGGLAVLVVLGGIVKVVDGDESGGSPAAVVENAEPPSYTVIEQHKRGVDLLVPKATKETATAAIHDWLTHNADHPYLTVQVVRSTTASVIVCRGEYVADARASELYTGGRIQGPDYPHIEISCPDPAGQE